MFWTAATKDKITKMTQKAKEQWSTIHWTLTAMRASRPRRFHLVTVYPNAYHIDDILTLFYASVVARRHRTVLKIRPGTIAGEILENVVF